MKKSYRDQYVQSIIVRGGARRFLEENLYRFEPITCIPSPDFVTLNIIGAGEYFRPFIQTDIECRCIERYGDIFKKLNLHAKINNPFPKECDLTSIVEFLRLGGTGYGYPEYNA